jgi:hypothetical protein
VDCANTGELAVAASTNTVTIAYTSGDLLKRVIEELLWNDLSGVCNPPLRYRTGCLKAVKEM